MMPKHWSKIKIIYKNILETVRIKMINKILIKEKITRKIEQSEQKRKVCLKVQANNKQTVPNSINRTIFFKARHKNN